MSAEPAGDVRLAYVTTRSDQIHKLQRYASKSPVARWFPTFAYLSIITLSWLSAFLFYARQSEKNDLYVLSGLLALLLTIGLPSLHRRYRESFLGSVLTEDNLRGLVGPRELIVSEVELSRARFAAARRSVAVKSSQRPLSTRPCRQPIGRRHRAAVAPAARVAPADIRRAVCAAPHPAACAPCRRSASGHRPA